MTESLEKRIQKAQDGEVVPVTRKELVDMNARPIAMLKSEPIDEIRRKFLLRFSQFILSDKQYDDLSFEIPQRKRHINSPIIIIVSNGTIWADVSWSLEEIIHPGNAGNQKQNCLIQCKFEEMLQSMKELEKESEEDDND